MCGLEKCVWGNALTFTGSIPGKSIKNQKAKFRKHGLEGIRKRLFRLQEK